MKTTYNPELRKTEIGKHLYYHWRTVRKKPHTSAWDSFPIFYEWAVNSGCTPNAKLLLVDTTLPYSPDNCVWEDDDAKRAAERAAEWNAVVNRIRKQFGMPPLEGT